MFLRRGQFRGRGRGGNDRDTNQRHFERQDSPVSIEYGHHGHRPVAAVPPAEDNHATAAANPGDNACSLPCSRHPTPSGGAAERMPRGASRMFALCVQGLGSTRTKDHAAKLDDGTQKLSPTTGGCVVGLPPVQKLSPSTGGCVVGLPPECEPPEQPNWVASFNAMHIYVRPRDEVFCSSNCSVQQPVGSVDESAKCCNAQLGIDDSHCERSETICDRTREISNKTNPGQKPPCNTGSDSGCPVVGGIQTNGVLDGHNVKDRSSVLKSGSRFYESRSKKVIESHDVGDGGASCRQGPVEGATAVSELPLEQRKRKKKKKRSDSRTTRRTNSECDTSDEVWERVADPKDKADIEPRRQTHEERDTYPERRGSSERVLHTKDKAGTLPRRHTNVCTWSEDLCSRDPKNNYNTRRRHSQESVIAENPVTRERFTEEFRQISRSDSELHDSKPELAPKQRTTECLTVSEEEEDWNTDHYATSHQTVPVTTEVSMVPPPVTRKSSLGIVDPTDKLDIVPRRQTNACTWSESLCSRESFMPEQKFGRFQRRQLKSWCGTNAENRDNSSSERMFVDSKTKACNARRRNSQESVIPENPVSRESFVEITKEVQQKSRSDTALHDPKPTQRTREYQTVSEEEEDWNTDHYATSRQTTPVTTEVSPVPLPVTRKSSLGVVDPNDKADIVQVSHTHTDRDTWSASFASVDRAVHSNDKADSVRRRQRCEQHDRYPERKGSREPKDKADVVQRRQTNTWSDSLCSGENVADAKKNDSDTRRRHSEKSAIAENRVSRERFAEEVRQKSRSDSALHDTKPGLAPRRRTAQYIAVSEEEDWNTDHYATSRQKTVPPPVTRKSSLGIVDPNDKADIVRVRHTHTEHDRRWSANLGSREVVDPERKFSRFQRRQVNSWGGSNPENRVDNCSELTCVDPRKKSCSTRRRHSEQCAIAENPVSRERFAEEVRQKSRPDIALYDPKPRQRTREYLTVSEEEQDWNTDHYATSRETTPVTTDMLTVPPSVTRKSSLTSVERGDNDTCGRDNDTRGRSRDISVADNAVGMDDVISHKYCRKNYYVIYYDMPDMCDCGSCGSATNVSDARCHAPADYRHHHDDRHHHADPTVDTIAPVGYNPGRFARPFTRGPTPLLRPSLVRSPVSPRLPPDGALYDYDFPAPFSPPEERDNLEDDTRVNGYKRHKSSHQLSNRGDQSGIHSPRSEMFVHSGYRGCAPPACQSRLMYPPPPPPLGDGSRSPAPPLMFLDSSGQVWATPPPDRPSQVWYPPYSSPPGWFPAGIQTAPMNTDGAPVQPRMTSPIDNNLQMLVSCLGPPPPPPPSPPPQLAPQSDEPRNVSQVEEKAATQIAARNRDDARCVVRGNERLSHRNDNGVNLPSKPPGDLVRNTDAATRYGNDTASNVIQSDGYPKHTRSDTVLSNSTRSRYGAEKDSTGCDSDTKWTTSPTSDKDAADDSLADDSLMHHCAGMAISKPTTTIEDCHQTTTPSSRGKVKFTISHYMPPTVHRSSSFSSVSPVVSAPRCSTDLNATAPCVPLSDTGMLGTPKRDDGKDGQNSTGSGETRPNPIRSPYGPWQLTSTPQDKRSLTTDNAIDFPFLTPRRKSSSSSHTRRVLASSDTDAVSPSTGSAVSPSTDDTKNQDEVSGSLDSDLNLCGLGSSVESSPASSQRLSQFRCCSASSNLSQETWSEQSVSFDDAKADVADSDEGGHIEEGEIDCFDGQPRKSGDTTHNRYRMFPDSTASTNPLYRSNSTYGGSYSVEQQTKYTSRAKYNLPPRMQRLLQASNVASRSQALTSKIQQQPMTIGTGIPLSTSARTLSTWQSYDWRTRLQDIFRRSSQLLLDSHCHIDFLYDRTGFKGTFKKYMAQNEETFPENFAGCVTVFCHPHTFSMDGGLWSDLLKEDNVWGAVGCHPKCATNFTARAERAMKTMLRHDKMVAVGEIGLDYSGTFYQHQEAQKEVLARQLKLALEINKPIVIHSRESEADILTELEKHIPRNHKIHRHCFTGTWEEARVWLHKFPNSYIGLTALLTHTSRRAFPLKDVARYIPLDKLLIETDTPYFVPWRIPKADMEFCHPGMVITVADEIAKLKGIDIDTVLNACYDNTRDMYGI